MAELHWLIARPVAHRGLHDQKGVIENTPSAFAAAIAARYGIECDLQISADGEAMVYHDDALGRLTEGCSRLDATTAAELKRAAFKATGDRMITLGELCDLVAGRTTLLIEMKSRFAGDRRPGRCDVVRSGADRGSARHRAGAAARHGHGKAGLGCVCGRAQARHDDVRAGAVGAAAIHRLRGARPAGAVARGCTQRLAPAATHLDRAQRR